MKFTALFIIVLLTFIISGIAVICSEAENVPELKPVVLAVEIIAIEEVEREIYIKNSFPTFTAEITAYCSCVKCTAPYNDGITASGVVAEENKTIAMGPIFPFGTKVIIDGFDGIVFENQDRGSAIADNNIDIYMLCHEQALEFGRQQKTVWILQFGENSYVNY